ncbi:hypothetical protein RN001_006002 [Aquatica leii]|uniref:ZAD domain-containing protein n=1 Tax=Aquatica leii TaxID=1421715 RepID=A0AAN7PDG8_9COLE|nr:hypothetical protein RN001_006002 [Aquatica leii]
MENSVCRLCASTNYLIDIFDSGFKYPKKIRSCLSSATGIDFKEDDESRMVCLKCCHSAITFNQFRNSAATNTLKENSSISTSSEIIKETMIAETNVASFPKKFKSYDTTLKKSRKNRLKTTNLTKKVKHVVDNQKPVFTKEELSTESKDLLYSTMNTQFKRIKNKVKYARKDLLNTLKMYEIEMFQRENTKLKSSSEALVPQHPSVKNLLEKHESIIIPKKVYNCDISPVITIDKNEVCNWYAKRLKYLKQRLQSTVTNKNCIINNTNRTKKTLKRRNRVLYSEDEDEDSYKSNTKIPKRIMCIYSDSDTETSTITTQPDTSASKQKSEIISSDMCGLNISKKSVPNLQEICKSFIQQKLPSSYGQHTKTSNQSEDVNIANYTKNIEVIPSEVSNKASNISNSLQSCALYNNPLRNCVLKEIPQLNKILEHDFYTNTEEDEKVVQYLCSKHYRQSGILDENFQSEVVHVENNEILLNDLFIMMKKYVIPIKFRHMPTVATRIVPNTYDLQQYFDKIIINSDFSTTHMSENVLPLLKDDDQIKSRFNAISIKNGEVYKKVKLRDNTELNLRVVLPVDMQSSDVNKTIDVSEKLLQLPHFKLTAEPKLNRVDFQNKHFKFLINRIGTLNSSSHFIDKNSSASCKDWYESYMTKHF